MQSETCMIYFLCHIYWFITVYNKKPFYQILFTHSFLEEQQRELQSSVSLLNPAGEDLAEIKQQEQQIVSLLNEQRRQDNELQRLQMLQQQRLEEQSNSFTHERKVCSCWMKCMFTFRVQKRQFYSLPFGQAVASMYYPTSHFNWPQYPFCLAGLITILL